MRTQYYTASSVDGFISTLDHSLEWLFQLGDIEETSFPQFILEVGALAMGSSTYEWMLRHVVKPGTAAAAPWPYAQPTWVFSRRTLPPVQGADIRFVSGDVRPVHERMRAEAKGRNVWLVGGGDLVGQFHDAGLLDELIVQVGSVTLGSGKPLLPRQIAFPPLRLVSVERFGTGFAELRYEVPRTGTPPAAVTASSVTTPESVMPNHRRLHFAKRIAAPVDRVWDTMLGPETYKAWTAVFAEGSYYEGTWEPGATIRFLIPSGQGMLATIAECRKNVFVSIEHLGFISGGVVDTTSDAVRAWAPAFENYTFRAMDGGTEVQVDQDASPEFEQHLRDAWPKALETLKALCERPQ